jgi:hypothetical protein
MRKNSHVSKLVYIFRTDPQRFTMVQVDFLISLLSHYCGFQVLFVSKSNQLGMCTLSLLYPPLLIMCFWLVVSCFIFHNIWVVILPIDELIFFKMVETTNQFSSSSQMLFVAIS